MKYPVRRPLANREDVQEMVDTFYAKVRQDPLIGPIFDDVAKVNWDEHLPKLYDFWSDLLLGTDDYKGRPFPPHRPLGLEIPHFERWLQHFIGTVDELFIGLKADEAKVRALRIARNFSINLGLIEI
ncbi:MAG: group III truncated hemoglobin [Bdellovibrionaceae bacterium]|nr:group III truncated hemoglobin [Pseudobdellovibrionaceae bacterium]